MDRTDHLQEFLKNDKNPDLIFDLDVAIKVCRTASIDLALVLSKRNNKHDFVISILTEDVKNFSEAIAYLRTLQFPDDEKILKTFGFILMENIPDEMTELLKEFCRMNYDFCKPEEFIHLFINRSSHLIDFLDHITVNLTNCNPIIYNTLIENLLKKWNINENVGSKTTDENRIMDIFRKYDKLYDKNHILILCRTYEFWPGIMYIYEEDNLYHLVVRYYLRNSDYSNLLSTCKRLGTNQPSLWLQTLTGLRNDKNAPANLLAQVLQVIAQEKLQSPLQVLNCLGVENGPTLYAVRDYFMQVFHKEKETTKQVSFIIQNTFLCLDLNFGLCLGIKILYFCFFFVGRRNG